MLNNLKIVALIPLRGGSKSIPNKNIKLIAGKPLCSWVLEAALRTPMIDDVYVSTDDQEIKQVVQSVSKDIIIIDRPKELATDEASTESVLLHFAEIINFDLLVTIQATSPLLRSEDLEKGIKIVLSNNYDSLLTGTLITRFFWEMNGSPINYDYRNRPRRQEMAPWIMENGAFYITKRDLLLIQKCRLGGKIGILQMNESTAFEIDEPSDWNIIEYLILKREEIKVSQQLNNLKILIIDVDGTLTDAGMYYSTDGEFLKKFNTRDSKGLELLRSIGMKVIVMTSEDSPVVKARMTKLKIKDAFYGVENKLSNLNDIITSEKLSYSEVGYIGDDINDLECLKMVGFSACPSDSVNAVKSIVDYICVKEGGKGAVREVCDLILSAKKTQEDEEQS